MYGLADLVSQLNETFQLMKPVDFVTPAQALRPGHSCTVHLPDTIRDLPMGGINVHMPITFDDGIRWLARVRQRRLASPLREVEKVITENEVETMMVLREVSDLVPEAYLPYSLETMSEGSGQCPLTSLLLVLRN